MPSIVILHTVMVAVAGGNIKRVCAVLFLLFLSRCAAVPQVVDPRPIPPNKIRQQYLVGPTDTLDVLVWKDPSLSRIALVRPDGKITLPLIGDIQAAGQTPEQLASDIKGHLKRFYTEQPSVSVSVTATRSTSYPVYILGEVAAPGKYILEGETTLLQVLSLAHGFTAYANRKNILLLRREGGFEQRMSINYDDVVSGLDPDMNILLTPEDTLIVQ